MNSGDLGRALREYRSPFEFVVEEALNDRKREQELKEEVEKEHKKKLFKSHKGKEADGPGVNTTSSSSIVTPTSWMLDEEDEEVFSPLALIPPELLESIFLFCDPKSLLSFRFVCKLWCSLIDSSNSIWRTKCAEVFELIPTRIHAWSPSSNSTSVSNSATASSSSSSSRSTEQMVGAPSQTLSSSSFSSNESVTGVSPSIVSSTSESMETKLAVNASLWQLLYAASLKSFKGSLISEAVSASSQDRKEERIEETLHLSPIGYWGSKGSDDEDSSEKLIYYLATPASIVTFLEIMPFKAHFQAGSPVYAPKACRFSISTDVAGQNVSYTSPVFPVAQSGSIQKFEIRKTLVCGSYLTVELMGRTQRQQGDNLYYTCLQYVALRGTPICNFVPVYNTENRDWELEYRSAGNSDKYVEDCLTFLEEKQEEIQKQQQKKLNFYCRFLRIPEVMRHLERLPSTDHSHTQQEQPPQEDEEGEEDDEEEELDGAEGTENLLYMLMNAEGDSDDDEDGYHDEDALFD